MLMNHLSHLLHGTDGAVKVLQDVIDHGYNIHAISAGHFTVYKKAILDRECMSECGQVFEIAPGRLSLNSVLRRLVKEKAIRPEKDQDSLGFKPFRGSLFQIAPGLKVNPAPAEGAVYTVPDTFLSEDAICLICFIAALDEDSSERGSPMDLGQCVTRMMSCKQVDGSIVSECHHDLNTPFQPSPLLGIESFSIVWLGGMHSSDSDIDPDTIVLHPFVGRGVEQIIQASALPSRYTRRSHGSCLNCIFQNLGGPFLTQRLIDKHRPNFSFNRAESVEHPRFTEAIKHIIMMG